MSDGLKKEHRRAIKAILTAHPRVEKAVLFGSRAMNTHTAESDVDIALYGDNLTLTDQIGLAGEIEEIDMPQRVDLLRHRMIKEENLLEHIRRHGKSFGEDVPTKK